MCKALSGRRYGRQADWATRLENGILPNYNFHGLTINTQAPEERRQDSDVRAITSTAQIWAGWPENLADLISRPNLQVQGQPVTRASEGEIYVPKRQQASKMQCYQGSLCMVKVQLQVEVFEPHIGFNSTE